MRPRSSGRSASLRARARDEHGDVRHQSRDADRHRHRDRLLAADRLPLPRGARHGGSEPTRRLRTMRTAGHAVLFSGATVAIGLACSRDPAAVHPLDGGGRPPDPARLDRRRADAAPRAALDLRRGSACPRCRVPAHPARAPAAACASGASTGFWARIADRSCAGRHSSPDRRAACSCAARSRTTLSLTPGSSEGLPRSHSPSRASSCSSARVGPGTITPLVASSTAAAPGHPRRRQPAIARWSGEAARGSGGHDRPVPAPAGRFVDPSGRYAAVIVADAARLRHRSGAEVRVRCATTYCRRRVSAGRACTPAAALRGRRLHRPCLRRLPVARRGRARAHVPGADARVPLAVAAAEGGDPQPALGGSDLRAARGGVPLGRRRDHRPAQTDQIEAWIPIFLFAMLFGLSMDYEVFLLSRMRELYDETGDNERAVALGLMRTGRIVTAAAAIMVAAFSGFMLGSLIAGCSSDSASPSRSRSTRRSSARCSCPP